MQICVPLSIFCCYSIVQDVTLEARFGRKFCTKNVVKLVYMLWTQDGLSSDTWRLPGQPVG
jgi:hypothetical protein